MTCATKTVSAIIFLLLTVSLNAQIVDWIKPVGSASNNTSIEEAVTDVHLFENNVSIIIGNTGGSTALAESDTISDQLPNSQSSYITKFNDSGSVLWASIVTATEGSAAQELFVDHFGRSLVGLVVGGTVEFDTVVISNVDLGSILLVKYDSNGALLWHNLVHISQTIDSTSLLALHVDNESNIILAGRFKDTLTYGLDTLITTGNSSLYLLKIDSMGNLVWNTEFVEQGDSKKSRAGDVIVDPTDNIYLIAQLDSIDFGIDTTSGQQGIGSLVKFDSNGNYLWSKNIGFDRSAIQNAGLAYHGTDGANLHFFISNYLYPNWVDYPPGFFYDTGYVSNSGAASAFGAVDDFGNLDFSRVSVGNNYSYNFSTQWHAYYFFITDMEVINNHIYFSFDAIDALLMHNLWWQFWQYPLQPFFMAGVLEYSMADDSLSILLKGHSINGVSKSTSIDINSSRDLILGGELVTSDSLRFGSDSIARNGHSEGFYLMRKACVPHEIKTIDNPCYADAVGRAAIDSTNLSAISSITWYDSTSLPYIDSLVAGDYTLETTDSMGCNSIFYIQIFEPDSLEVDGWNTGIINLDCFGDVHHEYAWGDGGVSPYNLIWSTGDTTNLVDSLVAGEYGITITDANGCIVVDSLIIEQPQAIQISVDSIRHPRCFGDSNGMVLLSSSGGNLGNTWIWDSVYYAMNRTHLSADTFSIQVFDHEGCTDDTTIILNEPDPLVSQIDSVFHPLCFGDATGYISAQVTGGTGQYSYDWQPGPQIATVASNRLAGLYTFVVEDSLNCSDTITQELVEPSKLLADMTIDSASCDNTNDGKITSSLTGGVPGYQYNWSNGSMDSVMLNVGAGTYMLTVNDSNGCTIIDTVNLGYKASTPSPDLGPDVSFCDGDSITLQPLDSAETYAWSNWSTNPYITVLTEGTYILTISDTSSGCTASDTIEITTNDRPIFSLGNDTAMCKDSILLGIQLNGPIGAFIYQWNTSETNSVIIANDTGTYSLKVVDSNQCDWTDSFSISIGACLSIDELSSDNKVRIYPNPNQGEFTIYLPNSEIHLLEIFSVDGSLIHRSISAQTKVLNLGNQPSGLYMMRLESRNAAYVERFVIH